MEEEIYIFSPPIVDLNIPQGLIELMQSIGEDFYKSIGLEEETKEVFQVCQRTQATRSLENFVYRKYKEDSEVAKEGDEVTLASAMRLILSIIATKISENRMENVNNAMNIPSKPK
ncbi:hypothetical protein AYI70_g1772 [Smittium culicis]|uniref:Uncharacterized protein n=1 Tax=Smittium culicis TaxID=133412 RepID=A0A1R1YB56_9FUNG|nr:hypothetical protein AYI70_g1772 [Smittium culicis]